MCGICGYASSRRVLDEATLSGMCRELQHRGPDDSGVISFTATSVKCGLGHVRLSIIDLAGGIQPMSNEDGTVWIAYNGEVYNHKELREDLEKKGHRYKTKSDTETLIHLYEEHGEESPKYLRGMFAYAIWDENKKKLLLVRDRLGIKPLYYFLSETGLVFASEIKALFKSGVVRAELANETLGEYFNFGYLTDEATLFRGVRKLLPGHTMVYDGVGSPEIRQYWNVEYRVRRDITEEEAVDTVKRMFFFAVESRMMSDVPLGMFLSGGLDSSAIAGVMSRLSSQPVKAFTVGFEKQYYSESGYARQVAEHNGMELHEVILKPEDFLHSIEKLIWHNDTPIYFPASVALYFVSKKAREHVKVVLTGEGSDELFGGYARYRACHYNLLLGKYLDPLMPQVVRKCLRRRLWGMALPLKIKKLVAHSFFYHTLDPEEIIFNNFYRLSLAGDGDEVINPEIFARHASPCTNYLNHYDMFASTDTVSRMLYTDQKTYLEELLMKQDKMSMAASIESRVPFLDHKLVEYAATLPSSMKVKIDSLKHVMKKAVGDFVPEKIIQRKKMGFPVPLSQWIREPYFYSYIHDILFDSKTRQRGVYNMAPLHRIVDEHQSKAKDNSNTLWMLLNFELWCRKFL